MEDISAFLSATSDFSTLLPLFTAADNTFGGLLPASQSDITLTIDGAHVTPLSLDDEAALFQAFCNDEADVVAPPAIPDCAGPASLPTPQLSDLNPTLDEHLGIASPFTDALTWTILPVSLDLGPVFQVPRHHPDIVDAILTKVPPESLPSTSSSPSPSFSPTPSTPPAAPFLAGAPNAPHATLTCPKAAATTDRPWLCPYAGCDKAFIMKHHRKAHIARRHTEMPEVWTCPVEGCGKEFQRPWDLERHDRKHRGEANFLCGKCEKPFTRKDKMRDHEKRCRGARAGSVA